MEQSRILWSAYGRIILNYVKYNTRGAIVGAIGIAWVIFGLTLRRPSTDPDMAKIVIDSISLAVLAGVMLNPNDKILHKDQGLLRSLASKAMIRRVNAQKIALATLVNLFILSRFYRGQALRYDIFFGVLAFSFIGMFSIRRYLRLRPYRDARPSIQALREAFVAVSPLPREAKALLRLHVFSDWQNYKMLATAAYLMAVVVAGVIALIVQSDDPRKEFFLLAPLLPAFLSLCTHRLENVPSFASLNRDWRRYVFLSEWFRWTFFWVIAFSLAFALVVAMGWLEPRHTGVLFAAAFLAGTVTMAWCAYIRMHFSERVVLRAAVAVLSLLFPLSVPVILLMGRRSK